MNNSLTPFSLLLAVIYTRTEAEKIQVTLSEVLENLYKVHHSDILSMLLDKLPAPVGEALTQQIEQKIINLQTADTIKNFCDNFSQVLKSNELLTLNIAFEPSYELTHKIADMVKTEFGFDTLIEFKIDPHVMGGAIITFKGQYLDYSLKNKIDHFLKQ